MEEMNFGYIPSVMDGTEWVFGAPVDEPQLPEKYSFRKFLPSVINQGELSICVPCSVSAYLNWRKNLETGEIKDNKVALMDIYEIRSNNTDGMSFKEALHYLRHNGVRSNEGILGINSYAMVKSMMSLKYALIMNGPCLGALPVYSDYCDFWNKKQGQRLMGYHAISICGYNEEGFIIRNSWGTGFCDKGYTLIPYEEFNKLLEVWTIID